jgi:hypothetical protein
VIQDGIGGIIFFGLNLLERKESEAYLWGILSKNRFTRGAGRVIYEDNVFVLGLIFCLIGTQRLEVTR